MEPALPHQDNAYLSGYFSARHTRADKPFASKVRIIREDDGTYVACLGSMVRSITKLAGAFQNSQAKLTGLVLHGTRNLFAIAELGGSLLQTLRYLRFGSPIPLDEAKATWLAKRLVNLEHFEVGANSKMDNLTLNTFIRNCSKLRIAPENSKMLPWKRFREDMGCYESSRVKESNIVSLKKFFSDIAISGPELNQSQKNLLDALQADPKFLLESCPQLAHYFRRSIPAEYITLRYGTLDLNRLAIYAKYLPNVNVAKTLKKAQRIRSQSNNETVTNWLSLQPLCELEFLDLTPTTSMTNKELIRILKCTPNLKVLWLTGCKAIGSDIIEYLPTGLRELQIKGCEGFKRGDLERIAKRAPQLCHCKASPEVYEKLPRGLVIKACNKDTRNWCQNYPGQARFLLRLMSNEQVEQLVVADPKERYANYRWVLRNKTLFTPAALDTLKQRWASCKTLKLTPAPTDLAALVKDFRGLHELDASSLPAGKEIDLELLRSLPEIQTYKPPPNANTAAGDFLWSSIGLESHCLWVNPELSLKQLLIAEAVYPAQIEALTERGIEALQISNHRQLLRKLRRLAQCAPRCKPRALLRLRQLDLQSLPNLTDDELTWITERTPKLSFLDVSGQQLISEKALNAAAWRCPELRHLRREGCGGLSETYSPWAILNVGPDVEDLSAALETDDETRRACLDRVVRKEQAKWRESNTSLFKEILWAAKDLDFRILYRNVAPAERWPLMRFLWRHRALDHLEKDITLIVQDDIKIEANRQLLAMLSEPLDILLCGKFIEAHQSEIELQDTSADALRFLVSFVATGKGHKLLRNLHQSDIVALWMFCDVYQLKGLKTLIERQCPVLKQLEN